MHDEREIRDGKIDNYTAYHEGESYILDKFDIGGKGNHIHTVTIDNHKFYFRAGGSMKWIYKRDTVSFKYKVLPTHNEIDKFTIFCVNRKGEEVQRGSRIKSKLSNGRTKLDGYIA
jgi:hypothetical protein